MSTELRIIKGFCDDRELEMSHYPYIESITNLEREIKHLFQLIHKYYKEHDQNNIPKAELEQWYEIKNPSSKNKKLYMDLIAEAYSQDLSPDLMNEVLDQVIEKHHATMIINKLLPVMEGDKYGVLENISSDVANYIDLLHNPPESLVVPEPCTLTLEELVEQEINDEGIPWHLQEITRIVGGVRDKTLGLIYAFVDSGKTSFSLASAASFCTHLWQNGGRDEKVCYAGNEESAQRLRLRFIQACTNWTRSQLKSDMGAGYSRAMDSGLELMHIFDEIVHGDQVKYILEEYKPRILFVDQATDVDIDTKRKSDGVEYQKQLFKHYRKLAGKYDCAIIGVSQGVGDAENTKWLKLSDIYGSRVAIQGALDYGIGIGRVIKDPAKEDFRYIHVPKNKLNDGEGGKVTTYFNKTICLWEEC
jgi:hypothetical protein